MPDRSENNSDSENENDEPLDQPDTNGELCDPNDSNEMDPLTRHVILDEIGSIHTTTYKGWHVVVGEHIDFLLYDNLQVSITDFIN